LNDVDLAYLKEDRRPAFVLDGVEGIDLMHCKAAHAKKVPTLVMRDARRVSAHGCAGLGDFQAESAAPKEM